MKLAFVDIETTGMTPNRNEIIEFSVILTQNLKIEEEYSTLIKPSTDIPDLITSFTGITNNDIRNAPRFSDVAVKLKLLLKDYILVAHNIAFDYSFLNEEFRKAHIDYFPSKLCSVKMFKFLHPGLKSYSLDSLIKHFNFSVKNRHRAYDDAKVIYDFFKTEEAIDQFRLMGSIEKLITHFNLKKNIETQFIKSATSSPGVYMFFDKTHNPLYIGKSLNIRQRLFSHFYSTKIDEDKLSLIENTEYIETIEKAGEFSALVFESAKVKELAPYYNKTLKKKENYYILKEKFNELGYKCIEIEFYEHLEYDYMINSYGLFKSKSTAKSFLNKIADQNKLCKVLCGVEKLNNNKSCFGYNLKKCAGACVRKEKTPSYNKRFEDAFKAFKFKEWPFQEPIVIIEKNYDNRELDELHIINKWSLIASFRNSDFDLELLPDMSNTVPFDTDNYKVLVKYFKKVPHNLTIMEYSTFLKKSGFNSDL
jgi:DNA polymerase III subunit epsilon